MKRSLLLIIAAIVAIGATALFVAFPPEGGGEGPVTFIDPEDPSGGGDPPPNPPSGQDNYQDGQIIYIDEGLSFKCWRSDISTALLLRNTHDHNYVTVDIKPSWMSDEEYDERAFLNCTLITNASILQAFRETFTPTELAAFGNEEIGLLLMVNKEGDIVRLTFGLDTRPVFTNVPAAKYGILYNKLKTYVKFHVADTAIYFTGVTYHVKMNLVAAGAMLFPSDAYWQ